MWLLRTLSWLAGVLPLSVVLWQGRVLGAFLYLFLRSRREEILGTIQHCLGVDRAEARRVVRGMYRNLGMTITEVLRLPHVSVEEISGRVTFAGKEKLPEDQGWIAVVAHTGNWEYMAATSPILTGRPLSIIVKSLKPEGFNNWLVAGRGRWGTKVIDRRGSVKEVIRCLKGNSGLGFMMDQNAKQNWGIFVDFFGKQACTTDGLAQFAAMTNVPIFPVFSRRLEDGNHLVEIGDAIEGPADRSDEEIHRITQLATKWVEDFVRTYPDQWIWMHRRWRTQPEA